MQDNSTPDIQAVEAQARAMRAAYAREIVRGLIARLRGARAPGAAAPAA